MTAPARVNEAFACKKALFAWLAGLVGTGMPLARVQVSYAWPGRSPELECIYGGGVRFTRAPAGHDGRAELWLETAVISLYVRVSKPGARVEDTDARAGELGGVLEQLLQDHPRLAGGFTFVGIAGGTGDYATDDNGPTSVLAYQVSFQYYLD